MKELINKYNIEEINDNFYELSVRQFIHSLNKSELKLLKNLKKESLCDPNFFNQWYHIELIIKIAYKAFNPVEKWFYEISKKGLLISQYDFLQDTIRFIQGHKREYSLITWNDLLYADGKLIDDNSKNSYKKIISPTKTTEDFIIRWCSQKNGINDLLYTMYMMFCNVVTDIPINTVHSTAYPTVRIV